MIGLILETIRENLMKSLAVLAAVGVTFFSLAFGIGVLAQNDIPKKNSEVTSSADQTNNKIMNIEKSLEYNGKNLAVLSIVSSEKLNIKAIGLKKGHTMAKHKAGLTSLLIVLKGKIEFEIDGKTFELNELDTYDIPVNVEHEIRGLEDSIFSLTQQK